MLLRNWRRAWSGVVFAVVACSACASGDGPRPESQQPISRVGGASIDDLAICDCVLPGKVIRQGAMMVRLGPEYLVRTSVRDCQIRGGKYVALDPADYSASLKRWLASADRGDVDAQIIVGEMYEKGLGTSPNFVEAARWYRLAANTGSARAAVQLGSLYERGLGVPKSPQEAVAWYRRGVGAQGHFVQFAPPQDSAPVVRPRATEPPVIRVTEPQLVAARDRNVRMASVEPDLDRLLIAGRVMSSSALKSLTVNGVGIQRATDTSFKYEITLTGADESVRIVASDQLGRVSSLEFLIRSRAPRQKPAVSPGEYRALVVGNGRYRNFERLDTVESDARDVAGILREKYGAKVTTLLNATRAEMLEGLESLRGFNDNVLIYYGGRCERGPAESSADPSDSAFYWLPIDADVRDRSTWVPSKRITQVLDTIEARQVLVLADSCGLETRVSLVPYPPPDIADAERNSAIATLAGKRARVVIASGGPAVVAKNDVHSIFAESLIQVLANNSGDVTGFEMFGRVKQRVAVLTVLTGAPEVTYTAITGSVGDFVFTRRSN